MSLPQDLSLDVMVDQVAEELKFVKSRSELKVIALLCEFCGLQEQTVYVLLVITYTDSILTQGMTCLSYKLVGRHKCTICYRSRCFYLIQCRLS